MNDSMFALPQASNQRALREIARDILGKEVGSRLATGSDYQQRLDVGAGTVQKALRVLTSSEAVTLRARGHRGTYIVERNLGRLWQIASLEPVRVLLTPPGANETRGLAAGLQDAFRSMGVPVVIGYLGGAEQRIREMIDGEADLAAVSGGAAEDLGVDLGTGDLTIVDLGPDTYYRPDSILVVSRTGTEKRRTPLPRRVGIDRSSYDHKHLTMAEFPDNGRHVYIDCDFPNVPAAILEDRIDVGIWHKMELLIPLHLAGLATRPLSTDEAIATRSAVSSAVLVADARRAELATVLRELDVSVVRKAQEALLSLGPEDKHGLRHWVH